MKLVRIFTSRSPTKIIPLVDIKDSNRNALELNALLELPPDPENNLVFDPRPVEHDRYGLTFEIKLQQGNFGSLVLMITRTDKNDGWDSYLFFRVYDRTKEDVPATFDSSLPYDYWGLYREYAPYDATVVKVHRTVTTIKAYAFLGCKKMTTCDMSDAPVEEIERKAFGDCTSLRNVNLCHSLKKIGLTAFKECSAIECLIIPPTVTNIDQGAFYKCTSMRILRLPSSINLDNVANNIIDECNALLSKVPPNKTPNQWLKDRYNQYPLHNVCYNAHVTTEEIQQCVKNHPNAAHLTDEFDMTALHMITIMACTSNLQSANGSASDGQGQDQDQLQQGVAIMSGGTALIMACFHANMSAAFVQDDRGKTPLYYLLESSNGLDVHTSLVASLCVQWSNASSEVGASSSSSSASQQHQHESSKRMRYH